VVLGEWRLEEEMSLKQNPGVASVLSFLLPGLGQVYALETGKGIGVFVLWMLIHAVNYYVTIREWGDKQLAIRLGISGTSNYGVTIIFVVLALALWVWSIYDARSICEELEVDAGVEPELEPAATKED
jgi:TM2 domain-containing membrane protein YozV